MSSSDSTPVQLGSSGHTVDELRELRRWQRKLLPFISHFLVVIAIGFFGISLISAYEMRNFIQTESTHAIRATIEELLNKPSSAANKVDVTRQGLLLIEADALDKRYRQASALLMSRIWTRQLAFMTGMVLAFIGAVFIIGKLSEGATNVSLGGNEWKAGIVSSSPGLVLAFLGTVLMGIALVVQPAIEIQDRPVYFAPTNDKNDGVAKIQKGGSEDSMPDPFANPAATGKPDQKPGKQGGQQ